MADSLPKFDKPPVVETALSAQFAPLPGYSTAHAGWFWKEYLAKLPSESNWTTATEAPRLEDHFEIVGKEDWIKPGLRLKESADPQRIQIVRADDERLVQVQNSRFILNWRKRTGAYPTYETLKNEFPDAFRAFEQFAREAGFGVLDLNQWEVTYVNHMPKGDMWNSAQEFQKIIPCLWFPPAGGDDIQGETLSANWRYRIGERGRMYVSLRQAKLSPSDDEVAQLVFTARGAVDAEKGWSLDSGFDIGHAAIVRSFAAMTSADAHRHWMRRA